MNQVRLLTLFIISVSLSACNGLGKMAKNASKVKYEVAPNPLEMHGDSVTLNVKGTYPAKYFAKKVDVAVTPSIKTSEGNHPFKTVTMVGEKSKTNGDKINQKAGGSFS